MDSNVILKEYREKSKVFADNVKPKIQRMNNKELANALRQQCFGPSESITAYLVINEALARILEK